jgi:hypothetical protein
MLTKTSGFLSTRARIGGTILGGQGESPKFQKILPPEIKFPQDKETKRKHAGTER